MPRLFAVAARRLQASCRYNTGQYQCVTRVNYGIGPEDRTWWSVIWYSTQDSRRWFLHVVDRSRSGTHVRLG